MDGKDQKIEIMPVAGGPGREVHRGRDPEVVQGQGVSFEPDGRHLLFGRAATKGGRVELQRILVESGQPQDIAIGVPAIGKSFVHPDGRRIFCVANSGKHKVWALENFLPKAAKYARPAAGSGPPYRNGLRTVIGPSRWPSEKSSVQSTAQPSSIALARISASRQPSLYRRCSCAAFRRSACAGR